MVEGGGLGSLVWRYRVSGIWDFIVVGLFSIWEEICWICEDVVGDGVRMEVLGFDYGKLVNVFGIYFSGVK